ncbi:MAG TPA: hypothetical protein VGZ48_07310 [Candidatus Acidoferrales bacterium]|nr:hypothetical protein [Candidatus Acidoferrales bacterium]
MLQLVTEHVQKTGMVISDPAKLSAEAHASFHRMQARLQADPALGVFTKHYSEALAQVIPLFLPQNQPMLIQSLIVQIVSEWEDINREFEGQLKVAPSP